MRARKMLNDCFFAEMKNDVFSLSTLSEHCSGRLRQLASRGTHLAGSVRPKMGRKPVDVDGSEVSFSLEKERSPLPHGGRAIHSALCLQAWGLRIGGPSARAYLWRDTRTVWQAGRASLMITSGRPTAPTASFIRSSVAWESHFQSAMIGGSGGLR